MPHLICPTCGLGSYSAAHYASVDRCPRCDTRLDAAERKGGELPQWSRLQMGATAQEARHGAR